jgi:threonine 3-dehydrogenase
MGTMRALRKTSARRGADLEDIPVPEPGEGEVLVRVHAASICGTDLHIYDWNEWAQGRIPRLPMTFGHEVAGWVETVGPEVHHVAPGAFVAADTEGAFAEYVVVPAANVWIVGEGIDPDHASVMEPFGNAVHAAFGTEGGEDLLTNPVAVIGCGPIGLFSVAIARALGAWKVFAIEPNDERRALAGGMGADLLVDPTVEDPVEVVLRETDGNGAEVVLEMSGNARAIDQGTKMLARGGRMSLLGLPDAPVTLDLNDQVIFKEAKILGITGREMFRTWQQTTTLLSTGRVDISPVITHRFGLERYDEAFETAASGRAAKVIMFPGA